jgi:prevent-host-death family protein
MIATLRESKANLSKLVERASCGEEVLITVRGCPKARLVAVTQPCVGGWAEELRVLHREQSQASTNESGVLDALREERW